MYQFFVPSEHIQGNRIVITGDDVNHIKNVLRMKVGEEIAVSNGEDGREYRCGIEEMGEEIVCSLRFIKEDGFYNGLLDIHCHFGVALLYRLFYQSL